MVKSAPDNPLGNALGSSLSDEAVSNAVKRSGYPLQLRVAAALEDNFPILQPEWSFLDRDSQDLRALDLLVARECREFDLKDQPRVRPSLVLLIECKRSELPYVFFEQEGGGRPRDMPVVAGLDIEHVRVSTDDTRSTWQLTPIDVMGLDDHPFLTSPPFTAATFTRCERKGSELVLSGNDPFRKLVFPIVKALQHFREAREPAPTFVYFDMPVALAVAVVEAPMVLAQVRTDGHDQRLVPWVRVIRHEFAPGHPFERDRVYAIDVVHYDYLAEWIEHYVLPFDEVLVERAVRQHVTLATGKGFAPGLNADGRTQLHDRIRPQNPVRRMRHLLTHKGGKLRDVDQTP